MIGMQYKVILPKDYDMEIIKKRVKDNGYKTDGFQALNFKAYLITETEKDGNFYNCYAPLYIWDGHEGMNKFIFEGYYDNILQSFGWQQIHIGVPLVVNLSDDFKKCKYVVEYVGSISQKNSLIETQFNFFNKNVQNTENCKGNVIVYNPDKWGYSQFGFYEVKPEIEEIEDITLYEVLHISQ
ncbi:MULTISPECIES: DUF4865 family protein [Bacillus]|jgi:hypothetical protein|uniref:DUF4865 domain-containing protein n=4 Tax=Bacillus cereus group TaxID=86661 RepID=A0A9W5R8I8_BACCE|nr:MULTISPECIES: DUF4865 family protein [Bacillus cereus group]MEB4840724.1 DUF4865 family protein [Paenibacillus jamilae]HCX50328.1 DUF4865 domain-containing protein [Bacillus sp. (in: firmicutes)]ARO61429.1 Uncharacterized protein B5E38_3970 [Bacillus cereus]ARO64433.1 Uncharacterized protein B5E39_2017 [Bacillus cereus]ASI72379.1 DUF4865 domain-containing protein [Bacillus cereus]